MNSVRESTANFNTVHPNYECSLHLKLSEKNTFKENHDKVYDIVKNKLGHPGVSWSLSADWSKNEIILFFKNKSDLSYLKLIM